MFIFNHQSGLDMLLVCKLLRRDFVGIAKRELKSNPIFGPVLSLAGTVFVDRFNHERAVEALAPAIEALRHGLSLAIAPEGTDSYLFLEGNAASCSQAVKKLEAAGVNVRVIAAISEELFDRQPESYRNAVLPPEGKQDLMFVMGSTRRVWPLRNVGAQADDYSLTADWENQWLTGGLEADVIAEAHLDAKSIQNGILRFAKDRDKRIARQRDAAEGEVDARRQAHRGDDHPQLARLGQRFDHVALDANRALPGVHHLDHLDGGRADVQPQHGCELAAYKEVQNAHGVTPSALRRRTKKRPP